MSFFKRLFGVVEAEAHAAVNKLEDPIKMTEQGIRDLRKDLQASLHSLAEVKALQIRQRRELDEKKQQAADYEKKAMLLLQRGQSGAIPAGDADRLAGEALQKKDMARSRAVGLAQELSRQDQTVAQLEANIKTLKSKVNTWEAELSTLKARAKVAGATKKINKQLAQVDSSGTIAMLERMKSKVDEDEALAASYGEIAQTETNIDAEINRALAAGGSGMGQASLPGGGVDVPALGPAGSAGHQDDALAALKAKMGMA